MDKRSAAMPDTTGVAAEQPLKATATFDLFKPIVRRFTPGATTSRAAPVPEKLALWSFWSVAPTEIVRGDAPGPETSAFPIPPFPAHAIRIDAESLANCKALFKTAEFVG